MNCVVDSDTWWRGSVKYRHSTINTPETRRLRAKCEQEIHLGKQATQRFQQLTANGFRTQPIGREERHGQAPAAITIPDGREAGAVLVSEGPAKVFRSLGFKKSCRQYYLTFSFKICSTYVIQKMRHHRFGVILVSILKNIAFGACLIFSSSVANAVTIIDNNTQGNYNASLGTSLNGTNPVGMSFLFPNNNSNPNDPTFDPVPFEPDLSSASAELGNWLGDPGNLNANWSGPQAIPTNWAVNTETAIVYEFGDAFTEIQNFNASFGIDNGIFVWLDGVFQGGQLRPGGSSIGEFVFSLANLSRGTHYLQVLREDHGGGTGYAVNVTGDVSAVPLPAALPLMGAGFAALGFMGWRRKRKAA